MWIVGRFASLTLKWASISFPSINIQYIQYSEKYNTTWLVLHTNVKTKLILPLVSEARVHVMAYYCNLFFLHCCCLEINQTTIRMIHTHHCDDDSQCLCEYSRRCRWCPEVPWGTRPRTAQVRPDHDPLTASRGSLGSGGVRTKVYDQSGNNGINNTEIIKILCEDKARCDRINTMRWEEIARPELSRTHG